MNVRKNVSLRELTTLKVGGVVWYVLDLDSVHDVEEAHTFARDVGLPLIPFGRGSNVLGHDGVVEAVVVRINAHSILVDVRGDDVIVTADAGVVWDDLVKRAVSEGWWGIENLSAIPGTVGGAVVQNIGAYGAVLSDVLVSVVAYDTATGTQVTLMREQCIFGYRTSIFKQQQDRYVILSVTCAVSLQARPIITYRDLAFHFGTHVPTLPEIRAAVIGIRAQKFPPLAEYGTAGSFFLNPIMSESNAELLRTQYPGMPLFNLHEGGVKVPLAWLLEHVVKVKGYREGAAHVWRDHALVIATDQGATARDVRLLAKNISDRVEVLIGIKINPEVRFL